MKDIKEFYRILETDDSTRKYLGNAGFVINLDKQLAREFNLLEINENAYSNLRMTGRQISAEHGFSYSNPKAGPYSLLNNKKRQTIRSGLLEFCNLPNKRRVLYVPSGEINSIDMNKKQNTITYKTHNINDKEEAEVLKELWLNWINFVSSL